MELFPPNDPTNAETMLPLTLENIVNALKRGLTASLGLIA
jgi:hypothetical protein